MSEPIAADLYSSLLPCTYGGVRLPFESGSVVGGRRATERPVLHSDDQVVSDVGLRQRAYAIRGWVAAREEIDPATGNVFATETYKQHRKALLEAFEDKTPKVLVHPIEGAIPGLIARSFSIEEVQNEVGVGRVSVEFIRDVRSATPEPEGGVASAVVAASEEAKQTTLQALASKWGVDLAVVGAYEDGLAKAREAFDQIASIANEAETLTDAADLLAQTVSEGVAAATYAILTPQRLVTDLSNAFTVLATAFPTALAAFEGMILGFDFGDLDFSIDLSVPSASSRKQNSDAMNVAMKAHTLADAYGFATGIDFGTLDEIERVEGILADQHAAIVDLGTADPELLDSLENLRVAFASFLDRARLTARRTTTESVAPTTPRALAFTLYGDDALAPTLAGLNDRYAYELLAGSTRVLSS